MKHGLYFPTTNMSIDACLLKLRRFSMFIYMLFSLPISSFCQSINLSDILLKDCSGGYIGQRADNSKDKSGTGIMKVENGGVYIGDFNRNKYNGKGMLIAGNNGKISNVPETYAYVGGFVGGKKQGRGTCYAPNGDIIYSGKFENDKPVGQYPSLEIDPSKYFTMMRIADGYYVGEVCNGVQHGFGLCLTENGEFCIGNSVNGEISGLCAILYGADEWAIVNYKDGNCIPINSSTEYQARNQSIKAINSQIRSNFWNGMLDVVTGMSEVGSQYIEAKNNQSGCSSSNGNPNSTEYSNGSTPNKSRLLQNHQRLKKVMTVAPHG